MSETDRGRVCNRPFPPGLALPILYLLQSQGSAGPHAVKQGQPGQVPQQPLIALQRICLPYILLHGGLFLFLVTKTTLRQNQ